jgi:alkanesulfonate monooxygenase
MPITVFGYVPHSPSALPAGHRDTGELGLGFIEESALAHEEAGFDSILIAYGAMHPDTWQVAGHVGHVTKRIQLLIANRPGVALPTLVARQAITLDYITGGGRVALHIISGGNEAEQQRDGDFVGHDDRYRRSGEFIEVIRRLWRDDAPFDYEGEFYRARGARSALRPRTQGPIPIFFAGESKAAIESAGRFADAYVLGGNPLHQTGELIDAAQAVARRHGRRLDTGVGFRVVLGATEAEAWERAQAIYDSTLHEIEADKPVADGLRLIKSPTLTAVSERRIHEISHGADVQDERLWLGYTRLVGAGGTTSALVGTPRQVADALMRYYDLGVRVFYLRGWDYVRDPLEIGRELIPELKRQAAAREAAGAAADPRRAAGA